MVKTRFLDIIQPCIDAFGMRISKDRIAAYYEHVGNYSPTRLEEAINDIITTQDRFPTISKISSAYFQRKETHYCQEEKDSRDTNWLLECEKAGKFGSRMCARMVRLQLIETYKQERNKPDIWNQEKKNTFIRTAFKLQKEVADKKLSAKEAEKGLMEAYGI